jgi:hypothetical protein
MIASSDPSPVDEYKRRQRLHEQQEKAFESRHITFGYVRLLLVFAIATTAWASLLHHYLSPLFTVLPVLAFVVTAVMHARVLRRQSVAHRAAEVYRKGLARIEDRWPRTTQRNLPADLIASSLYAADLDIVGKGSLFELLCVARTRVGELCLLEWLLTAAPLETIYQRQQAVFELRDLLDFRERMAISGQDILTGIAPETLKDWAVSSPGSLNEWLRWLAVVLAALAVCAAFVWLKYGIFLPLLAVLLVEGALARFLKSQMLAVLKGTEKSFQTLKLFSALLREVEQETFQTAHLNTIKRTLVSEQTAASNAVSALGNLVSYQDALHNPLLKFLDLPLMYSVHLAFAIQRWRHKHGSAVNSWLDALAQIEALLCLAAYSYEHPDDPFPSFINGTASLEAQGIGHPLIPMETCIRNSIGLGTETRVLLISGSNMSGKSTLMRTVGINVVLAMCGAPVRAKQMQLTPLLIGASLLVNDSLARGTSRFYAEIERIQAICELARKGGLPVLFLLDELLQGTNSNDRLVGAQGITRELMNSGAIGILTTHDLSLTAIENGEGWIKNAHFEDHIVNGKMQFDFQLRDGVITKSNGLELMRLIGLKV